MRFTAKKTVEIVLAQGNDLLVQVKGNQPTLALTLREATTASPAWSTHCTHDVGQHNRIERRVTKVWPFPSERFDPESAWRFGKTLIEVTRDTHVFNTRSQSWLPRQEISLYFCTRALTAAEASRAVRGHWGIENRLHHVRDRTLREDASRIRHKAACFARLRTWALNLLRFNGAINIADTLYRNALNFDKVVKYKALL